jgi:signal transduction histidine kinase
MSSLLRFVRQVFSGLRFRLLLLVLLTCAPLVAFMIHTTGEDRRRSMTNWQQHSQSMRQMAKSEERHIIMMAQQLLQAISDSSQVRLPNAASCKKWFDDLYNSNGYERYSNLGLLTTNGDMLASAMPYPALNPAEMRILCQNVLQKREFTVGPFHAERAAGKPSVTFGYPVLDNREVIGVVFAELDLNWIGQNDTQLPLQLSEKAATWAEVDSSGTILARFPRPEDWVGRPMLEHDLLQTFLSRPEGALEANDAFGVPTYYAFASMPSQLASREVITVLAIPRQGLFAQADRTLKRNLTLLSGFAAVALVLGWFGSKFLILRPVKGLVRFTARLASGDLSVRTGLPHSRDELGKLTLAFDQMAQALEERERERLRASQELQVLSHRLVEVQEAERRHIARELHDEIGQSLTAAELNLQAALQAPASSKLADRLEDSIRAVERVLEQVHDLSLSLRPSMLDDLGLEPALRWYANRQGGLTGMKVRFHADPLENRLDPVIETECFRVAQEALTNVVRHAKAKVVSVKLTRQDGHLHLSVRDDGVGFDVSGQRSQAVSGASLGLLSMEERASLAGGGLELKSAPGEGTEVHAWFPIRWQPNATLSEFSE